MEKVNYGRCNFCGSSEADRQGDRMKTYVHIYTGSIDTQEGWISSYSVDELDEREITAEQAFLEDEGVTLIEQHREK